jgi:hypothetical protein
VKFSKKVTFIRRLYLGIQSLLSLVYPAISGLEVGRPRIFLINVAVPLFFRDIIPALFWENCLFLLFPGNKQYHHQILSLHDDVTD